MRVEWIQPEVLTRAREQAAEKLVLLLDRALLRHVVEERREPRVLEGLRIEVLEDRGQPRPPLESSPELGLRRDLGELRGLVRKVRPRGLERIRVQVVAINARRD